MPEDLAPEQELTPENPFSRVPIEITISVGKARPLVRDLLRLRADAVLPLDKRVEDPVELCYPLRFPESNRETLAVSLPPLFARNRDDPEVQERVVEVLEDAVAFTPGNGL